MKLAESLKKRWSVWVWNRTPNCAEMSRLASQFFELPPPPGTQLTMALHYLVCVWCRRYSKHLTFLHAAAPRLGKDWNQPLARGLSAEAKRRLVQQLQTG